MVGIQYYVIDALANICIPLVHGIMDREAIRDVDACEFEDFIAT
jgi:hypothetical protein